MKVVVLIISLGLNRLLGYSIKWILGNTQELVVTLMLNISIYIRV